MIDHPDRRQWLATTGGVLMGSALGHVLNQAAAQEKSQSPPGMSVVGQPVAAKAGLEVLADGGNAVDAAVAAALVAGVVAVHQCGIGGYGGHMVIAPPRGRKVVAIDFNSTAP